MLDCFPLLRQAAHPTKPLLYRALLHEAMGDDPCAVLEQIDLASGERTALYRRRISVGEVPLWQVSSDWKVILCTIRATKDLAVIILDVDSLIVVAENAFEGASGAWVQHGSTIGVESEERIRLYDPISGCVCISRFAFEHVLISPVSVVVSSECHKSGQEHICTLHDLDLVQKMAIRFKGFAISAAFMVGPSDLIIATNGGEICCIDLDGMSEMWRASFDGEQIRDLAVRRDSKTLMLLLVDRETQKFTDFVIIYLANGEFERKDLAVRDVGTISDKGDFFVNLRGDVHQLIRGVYVKTARLQM